MIPISIPVMRNEEIEAIEQVLQSGMLAQGNKVAEFEQHFAQYIGTRYAIAVSSGTAALHTALLAQGIGAGDEVITTPFTFIATANSILLAGAKPVFVDIDEKTFNINVDLISAKITPRTKAILPVHLYGQACDMDSILSIVENHNLYLIEDACQAHGAEFSGRRVGTFGIGCFSFYPTKNMTTGEGGMITTNSKEIAEKAKMIREHGRKGRYIYKMLGFNYKMTAIAAAIGICQLKKLDQFNSKRIENARFLAEDLKDVRGIILPYVKPNVKHVFQQYTLRITEDFGISRGELKEKLKEMGIATEIYYSLPIHKQPLYKKLAYNDRFPVAEKIAKEVISLPVHPSLTRENLEYIAESLISCQEVN